MAKYRVQCREEGRRPRQRPEKPRAAGPRGIAIAGNTNVGKSTLFSRLSGTEEKSVNVPGTTVAIKMANLKGSNRLLFDTPGILSIFSANEDEQVSRDLLLPGEGKPNAEAIVVVADAKNLRRSLAIALQYSEYGLPMLLVVNMTDEAASRGITIDCNLLAQLLGIDVCPTVARESIGIGKVASRLGTMKTPARLATYPPSVEEYLQLVAKIIGNNPIPSRAAGLLLLTGDRGIERAICEHFGTPMLEQLLDLASEFRRQTDIEIRSSLAHSYTEQAATIIKKVQRQEQPSRSHFLVDFGNWCTRLSTGIPIAIAVLYLMYQFVGRFGATFLVDTINGIFFEGYLIPWTARLVAPIPNVFIRDLIIDPDFGVLPMGVFLALGLVMPVIFCFYIAFGLLEESGYLSRICFLLDRVFKVMGLNGKGVIPLVMGLSCVTMSILTTRILNTEKEKNIASFLVFLGMPCAPLIAVMLIILHKLPVTATLALFGILLTQVFIAGWLANKILPGKRTPLLMEIPPMRIPNPLSLLQRSAVKTLHFIREALPIFLIASVLVFVFQRLGGLQVVENLSRPIVGGLMGLPEKSVQVFIKTMIRRESGAAELVHLSPMYTNLQLLVNLLVMTMLSPCMNAITVLYKERGMKAATAIIFAVTFYALFTGTIVNHGCRLLGITFS